MKWLLSALVIAFSLSAIEARAADIRKLQIQNHTNFQVRVIVRRGEIKGNSNAGYRVRAHQTRTFEVVVPKGQCSVDIFIRTRDVGSIAKRNFDLCKNFGFPIYSRPR